MYGTGWGRSRRADPIGYRGGSNLYAYVGNDPLNQIDPLGLWQVTISGGLEIGGAVTFGYNSGQWNVGAWGGVGVGFAVRVNPSDAGLHVWIPAKPEDWIQRKYRKSRWIRCRQSNKDSTYLVDHSPAQFTAPSRLRYPERTSHRPLVLMATVNVSPAFGGGTSAFFRGSRRNVLFRIVSKQSVFQRH